MQEQQGHRIRVDVVTNYVEDQSNPGEGRFVFSYGIYFPEETLKFEAKHLVFLGRGADEWRFEVSS